MIWLVPFLFFCSGATALIYEVVWSKYLSLIFGSTVQAQTVVLAVFMGGLALGNWLFGRRADLLEKPLRVYGVVEVIIGIYAASFHLIYGIADSLFVKVGSGFLEQKTSLLIIKALWSAGLLLGPTILMGGTLPLLAAWLQKRSWDAEKSSAHFYAINTLGALTGSALAGFFLVYHYGVKNTLWITAGANIAIGMVAIVIGANATPSGPETPPAKVKVPAGKTVKFGCVIVFLTGAASMALEVLASRTLSLIFGSSLQAFAMMLMSFILGIGLGSLVVSLLRNPKFLNEWTAIVALLSATGMIGVFLLTTEQWAILYLKVRNGIGDERKYFQHQVISGVIALIVLGIPAALIGSVLPLWIRLTAATGNLAERVGWLLTMNTIGAVTGALLGGFILMPMAGLRLAFGVVGVMLSLAALLLAQRSRLSRGIIISGFSAAGILTISLLGNADWQYLLNSGIFRIRQKEVSEKFFADQRERDKIIFYEDGTDATVSVVTDRQERWDSETSLKINGKPDASTLRDLSTQYMLAHLPMMMRPESEDVFVLGFGSGISAGAVLGHPIKSLTIAENCEPVLNAASYFVKWNRDVLKNPLTRLYREDARTVLKLNPKLYDVFISEPSNPWVAGMSSVFSREFYELAASRLKEGGIFAQWFHIYEMDDEIVNIVLRTLKSVFPAIEIWETRSGDLILLGAKQPWTCSPEVFQKVFLRPSVRKDLERIDIVTPQAVLVRQLASQETAPFISGEGRCHFDFVPVLDYEAPRAFYRGQPAYALFTFDERTWQTSLAPLKKREALSSLSRQEVSDAFRQYGTANGALYNYLYWYTQVLEANTREDEVYQADPYLDVIFRKSGSYPVVPQISASVSKVHQEFREGEALCHQPDRWNEGVKIIEAILKTNHFESKDESRAAHFAAVAARACFRHGELDRAMVLAEMGAEAEPRDIQLSYLIRFFEYKKSSSVVCQ